jgi:hypothetical protein
MTWVWVIAGLACAGLVVVGVVGVVLTYLLTRRPGGREDEGDERL